MHNQRKQITLCKVPAHTGIKEHEAKKAAKQAIDRDEPDKTISHILLPDHQEG